jgi:T-complex protein 1 subunit delta
MVSMQVVSQYSSLLAPMAVDAVLNVIDPARPNSVDLKDIKVLKKLGGTVDDTEMINGLVFDNKASHLAGGPTRVENAKIGLIQFQISPPKTDIEQNVIVSDYTQVCCFVNHQLCSMLLLTVLLSQAVKKHSLQVCAFFLTGT